MSWFRRSSALTCQQAVELVTAYLDNALPAGQRERLERHLAQCDNCAQYLHQIEQTIAATGRVSVDQLTPQSRAALLDLYRATRG
jgi:anti-sigma factor RsiW